MKDKGMRLERRMVLTYIPAEKRKEVYEYQIGMRIRTVLPLVIWAVAFTLAIAVMNILTNNDEYIYGFIAGIDMFIIMLIIGTYRVIGNLWRPVTDEERDELGDGII